VSSFPSDFRDNLWIGLGLGVEIRLVIHFFDRNVVPGSTKYVDPGTSLSWQNHGDITPDLLTNWKFS